MTPGGFREVSAVISIPEISRPICFAPSYNLLQTGKKRARPNENDEAQPADGSMRLISSRMCFATHDELIAESLKGN